MSERIVIDRLGDGLYVIRSNYFSRALVNHAKRVPGMRFDYPSKTWRGYPDAVAAVAARLQHDGIHVENPEDIPDPESWRTAHTPYLFATKNLREYQVEGVRFLIARAKEGALLADSMRLGKSLQAITAARAFKLKTLVVCPSHVVGVWGRPPDAPEGPGEIAKWWPDAWTSTDGQKGQGVVCLESVRPFKPQDLARKLSNKAVLTDEERVQLTRARDATAAYAEKIRHVQVVVCHQDLIYAWLDVLRLWGFKTLIIDEGHIFSGYQSRRSNAIKELRSQATFAMVLTGTPITNVPQNAHNIFELIAPGRLGYFFGTKKEEGSTEVTIMPGCYANVFCDARFETVGTGPEQKTVPYFKGRSNLDKPDGKKALTQAETLNARVKYFMLRRLKKDVDPQLPLKQRVILDVNIPAKAVIGLKTSMLTGKGDDLRQALNAAADGKFNPVMSILAGHIDEQETTIAFCFRRLFTERVADEMKKKRDIFVTLVHGGLTQRVRDRRIHEVKSWTKGPALLAGTIDTTSASIDLSFANVATVCELTWEPHELAQLEERLYKYDAGNKYLVEYVIARGTGDELILRAVINKLDTFEKVIGETGDNMRADFQGKPENNLKRLYDALVAMQAGSGIVETKKMKWSKS